MPILTDVKTDPNKILPIKYPWAREYHKSGLANNWTPEEVPMQDDIELWKSDRLSDKERKLILWNLGFFSTAESLTANNIVLAVYNFITDPGCRQYLLRQAFEEAIHTDTFIYCCDSLVLDPEYIYTMYRTIPTIQRKDEFVVNLTQTIFQGNFAIKNNEDIRKLLLDLVGFYVIMEGIFFYAGFAMMLALKRQKKMIGVGEQFEFILRDEAVHLAFGTDLINTIKAEYPGVWTKDLSDNIIDLIKQAVILESDYAKDACEDGIFGISTEQFVEYVQYIADRRLERLDLPRIYEKPNPFPWLAQSTDFNKKKNFFETRVTEYQSSGLEWDF